MRFSEAKLTSFEVWDEKISELNDLGEPPSFTQICELAACSPYLKYAFNFDSNWIVKASDFLPGIASRIEQVHGVNVSSFLADAGKIGNIDIVVHEAIIAASVCQVKFDGMLLACGNILSAGVDLHPDLRTWLAGYLTGLTTRPTGNRGPDGLRNLKRDDLIVMFLAEVQKLGFPVSENEATASEVSACHAVIQAWGGGHSVPSAKRLMNIWSTRNSHS